MKIAVAQTRPVKGDIEANLQVHRQMTGQAVTLGAGMILFPELSVTGYEPELAMELATTPNDPRFDDLQQLSDRHHITICVGMPIRVPDALPHIGLICFQAGQPRLTYAKQYLHADEVPYFTPGATQLYLQAGNAKAGLAICYELSVPEHAAAVHRGGAEVYLVSEAKTVPGVEKAIHTLTHTAQQFGMTVLMSNCTGFCDNAICGGRSAIWNNKGEMLAQLDADHEGILLLDLATGQTEQWIG